MSRESGNREVREGRREVIQKRRAEQREEQECAKDEQDGGRSGEKNEGIVGNYGTTKWRI